jgi:protein-S-isoprenylcysteine O-methyltransferase Ste14
LEVSYAEAATGLVVFINDRSIDRPRGMMLRQRWINLLHRVATGARKTRMLLTPIGALFFGAFTTVFVLVAVILDRRLRLPGLLPERVVLVVAIPIMTVGVAVAAWSVIHFLKVKGTPVPFNPPPKLVVTGPYRFVRNPMLAGVFLILFGIGFAFNSLSLVLVFTPLYIWVNVWELKQIEEPELVKRLGKDYVEYRKKTPMFIPGWKTPNKK